MLEKRVAATLGTIPQPDELMAASHGAPRGRVARLMASRARETAAAAPGRDAANHSAASVPVDSGAWYHLSIGEGLAVSVRADHPAARSSELRARVATAVARVLADSAEEAAR